MAVDKPPAAPQDAGESPAIRARSLMVGQRGQSWNETDDDSPVDASDRSGNRLSKLTANSKRTSVLNISQASQDQATSAAHLARSRSDEETLAQTVADAGLNAFGCVAVEVWVMRDDGTALTRPDGGHWMDPAFAQSLPSEPLIEKAWELDRYADDCPPGAGLAGTMAEEGGLGNRNVHWAQIKRMLNDPFIQRESGKRMERFFELGIGLVAAVPFQFQDDCRGIVLFYSRSKANIETLRSKSNERFLVASSDVIGSNYAVRTAREESAAFRKGLFREAIRKARKELLHEKMSLGHLVMDRERMDILKKQSVTEAEGGDDRLEVPRVDRCVWRMTKKTYKLGLLALKRVNNSRRKWRGAKLHGPPRQTFSDCASVFIGVFLVMLTILKIDKVATEADSKFDFDPGWYSSTLCIVFALTPAPVGQPRQIVAAHLWNMLVGLACRQIPSYYGDFMDWSGIPADAEKGLPQIWVLALACALGVSGQAKIGILHPPATGLSMTFASKPQWTWTTIISVMLADGVVIVLSMVILNLSEKKQWPLYWLGFGWEESGGTVGMLRKSVRSVRRGTRYVTESVQHTVKESVVELKAKESV